MTTLLGPLTKMLNWIECLVLGFFYMVADGIIWAVNMLIAGIAAGLALILLILPSMPTLPSLPSEYVTAEGWIAWFWPMQTTVDIIAFVILAWLIWLGVSILLRWAKALGQ